MLVSVILGLVIAFGGLIVGYAIEGGTVQSLVLLSPFLIVFGGTLGAVIASYGLDNVSGAFKSFLRSLGGKGRPNPEKLIQMLSGMSDRCRREGLLVLQEVIKEPQLADDQYLLLKEGMLLALDMSTADQIREVLESDIDTFTTKKQMEIAVFEGAAGFSPTLGIIGTVMGLVQVLGNISDAEHLTASIAVAFIATLYGVVFANLIYMPIANQMKNHLKRQKIYKQIMVDGICLVASGEMPANLETKLAIYYPAFPKGDKKYKSAINS